MKGLVIMTGQMLKRNTASFNNGFFVIQSCDEHEANIGIFRDGARSAVYRHVEVPSLCRNRYERDRPGELTGAEFDQIIAENKEKLLRLIDELNS